MSSSIADEITRLSGCRNDILSAISSKGVTVPADSVLSSCPALINSIPTGGGGAPTGMINSGFSGTGSMTYYQPFTAEQKQVPVYDEVSSALSLTWETLGSYGGYQIKDAGSSWFNLDGSSRCKLRFTFTKSWQSPPRSGSAYIYDQYIQEPAVGTWEIKDSSMSPFTAEAEFTASSDQPTFSLALDGLSPWAFTGNTGVTGYNYEQTGTDFPYPQYDMTTTGAVSGNVTGVEYWSSWNDYFSGTVCAPIIRWSGFNDMLYGSGPSTHDTVTSFNRLDAPFVSGYLNSAISSSVSTGSPDTGYTYSFGPVESSYQGYTGI